MNPVDLLQEGRSKLDPILIAHGFSFKDGGSGKGSGGYFARGTYVNGERELEIHFRYSLGLVTYHFGQLAIDHESYMRSLLGTSGGNKYPGFSEIPLDGFSDLAFDLQSYCGAFLNANRKEFERCVELANELKKLSGFERLTRSES